MKMKLLHYSLFNKTRKILFLWSTCVYKYRSIDSVCNSFSYPFALVYVKLLYMKNSEKFLILNDIIGTILDDINERYLITLFCSCDPAWQSRLGISLDWLKIIKRERRAPGGSAVIVSCIPFLKKIYKLQCTENCTFSFVQ